MRADKVEGLVDSNVRGGSTPLSRTWRAPFAGLSAFVPFDKIALDRAMGTRGGASLRWLLAIPPRARRVAYRAIRHHRRARR